MKGWQWWRFDEYQIISETHIAPVERAVPEVYEPLSDFDACWGNRGSKTKPTPYEALARLSLDSHEDILNWCSEYGLLGILSHRTLEARFWPRWVPYGWEGAALEDGLAPRQRVCVQQAGWSTYTLQPNVAMESDDGVIRPVEYTEEGHELGARLTSSELAHVRRSIPSTTYQPNVRVRSLNLDGRQYKAGIVEGWAQFFPFQDGVSRWVEGRLDHSSWPPATGFGSAEKSQLRATLEQCEYPLPDGDDFMRQYGEPLYLFRRYAEEIKRGLELWKRLQATAPSRRERLLSDFSSPYAQGFTFRRFQAALCRVHPLARTRTGPLTWYAGWGFPSLYAALHLMMHQDVVHEGRRVTTCSKCGHLFATQNSRQEYCSHRCKKASEMSRYRRRQAR